MALTVNSIMSGVMSNPDVAVVGLAAGFLLRWAMSMKKRRSSGVNI
jgi:hypothetical protein